MLKVKFALRALLVGVLMMLTTLTLTPTVRAQCEGDCPTPTSAAPNNTCPAPLATLEKPDQAIEVFDLTETGILIYLVRSAAGSDIYSLTLTPSGQSQKLCTNCGLPIQVEGDTLIYTNVDGRLQRVPLVGGEPTRLDYFPADMGTEVAYNTLTPDGQYWLSLLRITGQEPLRLYRADATGGNVTFLTALATPNQRGNAFFRIADDNTIIFTGFDTAGVYHLYAQPIMGEAAVELSAELSAGLSVNDNFLPAGDKVYFTTYDASQQKSLLYGVSLTGENLTQLAEIEIPSGEGFKISPDGATLVYQDGSSLFAIPLNGENQAAPVKIFELFDYLRSELAFTEDSQSILLLQSGSIYRVPLVGGEPQLMTSQLIGNGTTIGPDYVGDWMIHSSYGQGTDYQEYFLIAAGIGPMVKFASSPVFGGWGRDYLVVEDRIIYENGGAGYAGIYTATLNDLANQQAQVEFIGCSMTQGSIGLAGVSDNQLVYIAYTESADSIYLVPLPE